jgi:hypothetical protein
MTPFSSRSRLFTAISAATAAHNKRRRRNIRINRGTPSHPSPFEGRSDQTLNPQNPTPSRTFVVEPLWRERRVPGGRPTRSAQQHPRRQGRGERRGEPEPEPRRRRRHGERESGGSDWGSAARASGEGGAARAWVAWVVAMVYYHHPAVFGSVSSAVTA